MSAGYGNAVEFSRVCLWLQGSDYDAFSGVAKATEDAAFVQTTSADAGKAVDLSSHGIAIVTNHKGERRGFYYLILMFC